MDAQQIAIAAALTLMLIGGATVYKGAKAVVYRAPRAAIVKTVHVVKHMVRHPVDSAKDGAIKPGK